MIYSTIAAISLALLFAETARASGSGLWAILGLVAFTGVLLSLDLPRRLIKFTLEMDAASVLTRLMNRAAVGGVVMFVTSALVWLLMNRYDDPRALGELYAYAAIGVFLFHGFGETMATHAMYLQQTRQYKSNQLVAVLLTVTLLVFTLALYFLAFDLAKPPELHAYVRDMLAITAALIGYGRAVYLMAHH